MDKASRIIELLPVGEKNAVKGSMLRKALGFSEREFYRIISRSRRSGVLICANDKDGYFLPENRKEARKSYKVLSKKAISVLNTLKYIREYAEGVDGQEELGEVYEYR